MQEISILEANTFKGLGMKKEEVNISQELGCWSNQEPEVPKDMWLSEQVFLTGDVSSE